VPSETAPVPVLSEPTGAERYAASLERKNAHLQTHVGNLEDKIKRLSAHIQMLEKAGEKAAHKQKRQRDPVISRTEHLQALRDRDDARERALRLETLLSRTVRPGSDQSLRDSLDTGRKRQRYELLVHAMRRAAEHFGVILSYSQMLDLNAAVQPLPVVTHTRRGTPVKQVDVQGKTLFLLLNPDVDGVPTITTVYTRDMLKENGVF